MSHSIRAIKNKNQNNFKIDFQKYIANPAEPNNRIKYNDDDIDNGSLLKKADRYYWKTKRDIRLTAQRLRLNTL